MLREDEIESLQWVQPAGYVAFLATSGFIVGKKHSYELSSPHRKL